VVFAAGQHEPRPPLLAGCWQARRSGGINGSAMLRRSRGVETCSVAIMKAGEQPVVMVRWWNHAGIETADLSGGGSSDRRGWPRDLDLDAIPLSLAKAENDRGPYSSRERGLRGSMVSVRPALGYSWPAVLMDCQPSRPCELPPPRHCHHPPFTSMIATVHVSTPPGTFGTARRSMPPDRPASRQPAKRGGPWFMLPLLRTGHCFFGHCFFGHWELSRVRASLPPQG
jgi:hypothetical protein